MATLLGASSTSRCSMQRAMEVIAWTAAPIATAPTVSDAATTSTVERTITVSPAIATKPVISLFYVSLFCTAANYPCHCNGCNGATLVSITLFTYFQLQLFFSFYCVSVT